MGRRKNIYTEPPKSLRYIILCCFTSITQSLQNNMFHFFRYDSMDERTPSWSGVIILMTFFLVAICHYTCKYMFAAKLIFGSFFTFISQIPIQPL
jgi:hypothetical protein